MKLSFIHSDEYVTQEVQGETIKFYPMSMPTAFKLKQAGRTLARAFAAFYAARQQPTGHKMRDISDPEGGTIHEFEKEGLPVEMYRERNNQADVAIDQFVEALTAPPNWDALCHAIAESMREVRQENGLSTPELAKQIKEECDTMTIIPLLKGLLAANTQAFGDVGKTLAQTLNRGLGEMTRDFAGTTTQDGSPSKTDGSNASSEESAQTS